MTAVGRAIVSITAAIMAAMAPGLGPNGRMIISMKVVGVVMTMLSGGSSVPLEFDGGAEVGWVVIAGRVVGGLVGQFSIAALVMN